MVLPFLLLCFGVHGIFEVLSSHLFTIAFDIIWFYIGTVSLLEDRALGAKLMSITNEDENKMGFGQLVPLVLLAVPIFSAMEIFFGM